jgi:hypothetical protein
MKKVKFIALAGFLLTTSLAFANAPKSVTKVKFGNDSTLFIGDSKSATLYAYYISEIKNSAAQKTYNFHDLSTRISNFAKVDVMDILIRDMAIHPTSKEAYIAFDTKTKKGYVSQIVIINQTGKIRQFDLINSKYSKIQLNNAPTSDLVFWDKTPMRSLTFTDIDYHKGKVYISGMSNAEFSSSLRVVDYPFNGEVSSSSIEIFHAAHGQNETRAPIQTLQFVTLNNEDYILAAYTCTPLVLIPVKELKNRAHVVGKTIAEMGFGNTPVDIIKFKSKDFNNKPYEGIILSNRNRSAQFVNIVDLEASAKQPSIGYAGIKENVGTSRTNLPLTGILKMNDQDGYHILVLRRNDDTGSLELLSFPKNMYLRIDEFISEYDQPTYKYAGQQLQMKESHNMMIRDLGLDKKFLKN